jgi:hypothetical protein
VDPAARDRTAEIAATVVDAGAGAVLWAWHLTRPARDFTGSAAATVAETVLRFAPSDVLATLTERGRAGRAGIEQLAGTLLRFAVRHVVAAVVETVDLTELVRRHVDLDAVAAGIDLDAAVARVDIDAAAARLDLDAAVARVDLDAILTRVDLDAVVARVDLEAVVRRIDLDAVARRIDLGALAARIDPDPVVARVDLDAILTRVDVVGIAREVIDAIDLPEIVRRSTGTLTSDTIRTVRREAMQADEVVGGLFDRLLHRQVQRTPVQRASAPS